MFKEYLYSLLICSFSYTSYMQLPSCPPNPLFIPQVMSEELRSMEVLSRNFSEVITEMLKSTAVPQVVIEAR